MLGTLVPEKLIRQMMDLQSLAWNHVSKDAAALAVTT